MTYRPTTDDPACEAVFNLEGQFKLRETGNPEAWIACDDPVPVRE